MANPSAFLARARGLLAKATPGDVGIWGEADLPDHDDLCIAAFDIAAPKTDEDQPSLYLCNVGSNGGEHAAFAPVDAEEKWPVSLANARKLALGWNSLAALCDVVEAADRMRRAYLACCNEETACDADTDNFHGAAIHLDSALAKLEVPTAEESAALTDSLNGALEQHLDMVIQDRVAATDRAIAAEAERAALLARLAAQPERLGRVNPTPDGADDPEIPPAPAAIPEAVREAAEGYRLARRAAEECGCTGPSPCYHEDIEDAEACTVADLVLAALDVPPASARFVSRNEELGLKPDFTTSGPPAPPAPAIPEAVDEGRTIVTVTRRLDDKGTMSFDGTTSTTVRPCRDCGVLICGGPTRCLYCAHFDTASPAPSTDPWRACGCPDPDNREHVHYGPVAPEPEVKP